MTLVFLLALTITQIAATTVSQYNVTITFKEDAKTGTFANGDFWVQGPVTLVATSPSFNGTRNGFEVNVDSITQQGFDSRIVNFNATRVPTLPYTLQPGDRLVKTVSVAGPVSHSVSLQTAIVVTIVSSPPPKNALRPPYFGADLIKGPSNGYWTADMMDLTRLESTAKSPNDTSVIKNISWISSRFSRLQLDHLRNYVSRQIHPLDNMPAYGAEIASDTGDGAMRLMLKDAIQGQHQPDVQAAMTVYVQMGLDIYAILINGGSWPANGGHENGRKLPLAFAGVVLADRDIQLACKNATIQDFSESDELQHHPLHAGRVVFGQVNIDPLAKSGQVSEEEAYWTLVTSGDGFRTGRDPYGWIDGGAYPGSYYQFCCTSEMWKGTALPIGNLSAPLKAVANLPYFREYVDRWVSFGAWAQPDPCAPPTGNCSDGSGKCTGYIHAPCGNNGKCMLSMAEYGKAFGPDGNGDCIKDMDSTDGMGRFPSLHGSARDQGSYASKFSAAMWRAQL
eukprot:TRINITY_DN6305_c0_g2_i1.p1 TRINITY_DN6305_c0_g2~~TRINITY_DN6305_c0_g2_i1.p1  ORF type:complete len:508 (+),score=73.02 TRINITY_DN6305_c0_g2_i1:20-1543(+)